MSMTSKSILCCLFLSAFTLTLSNSLTDRERVKNYFQTTLLKHIGNNGTISEDSLAKYFVKYSIQYEEGQESVTTCLQSATTSTEFKTCLQNTCLSPSDVYQLSGLSNNISSAELSTLSPILLHLLERPGCFQGQNVEENHHKEMPSSVEAWGYSILFVTVINLCSLAGVVVLPFIHKTIYKKMLICMVAIAVGTLAGSSLLFLIPEALEIVEDGEITMEIYVWKMMTVVMGIYVFYLIEQFLKMIMKKKQNNFKRSADSDEVYSSFKSKTPQKSEAKYKNVAHLPHTGSSCSSAVPLENSSSSSGSSSEDLNSLELDQVKESGIVPNGNENRIPKKKSSSEHKPHGHSHYGRDIAPVAWMIIFGDGVHNFIDGVSIGAAFTESILAGISVSLAIFCEELPHELGDFAVLLNAGMKLKKAVCFNFLSATMCYLGLIVGILLGENTTMHSWVFAFAGGMFLYISLVDMMPEMNSASESEENQKEIGCKTIFILQNIGLFIGFGAMLLMAVYGGHINFE